jgi:putative PIN family toxin of toxin-antitoxin system
VERVVLDPGVLVSSLITPAGAPATLWRAVLDERLEIIICPHLLAELAGVLERPKFRRYFSVEESRAFVAEVARRGHVLPDPVDAPKVSRDPDDDYLVALARVAGVRALVSGDRDLTEMVDPDPPVLTPAQAVDQLLR